jgi:hypothetical protein
VLAAVGKLPRLQSLEVTGSQITDAGLAHLGTLRRLKSLSLQAPKITDAGIAHLERLTDLTTLHIKTQVGLPYLPPLYPTDLAALVRDETKMRGADHLTNESLRAIGQLPRLVALSVHSTGVSCAGLVHLRGSSSLQFLELSGPGELSTEDLAALEGLQSLRRLALFQTHISTDRLTALRQTNPQLRSIVTRDWFIPSPLSPLPPTPRIAPPPPARPILPIPQTRLPPGSV